MEQIAANSVLLQKWVIFALPILGIITVVLSVGASWTVMKYKIGAHTEDIKVLKESAKVVVAIEKDIAVIKNNVSWIVKDIKQRNGL